MRLDVINKRMAKIQKFLASRGAEVLAPTNPYEVLRFRTIRGTSVLYKNDRGHLKHTGESETALTSYFSGGKWNAGTATTRRKHGAEIETLLTRDGDDCFLCCAPLGDDITREHLLALVHGGIDHIANMALAHTACNLKMHHLSLMEKLRMREKNLLQSQAGMLTRLLKEKPVEDDIFDQPLQLTTDTVPQ